MKNLVKKSTLVIALFIATLANANVNFGNIRLFSLNAKSLNLELQNNDGALNVSIKDMYGVELYEEQFKGKVFSKKFDLGLLPDGNYIVEIEGQTKINVLPFKVKGTNVEVLEFNKSLIHKPIVRIQEDLVFISKFSQAKEVTKIVFYDSANNILAEDKLRDEVMGGKIFSLAELPKGKYLLVATYGNERVYTQEIIK
jgi:hypothetical protein